MKAQIQEGAAARVCLAEHPRIAFIDVALNSRLVEPLEKK